MTETFFQARNLSKRYGEATVVRDLSFDLAPGECLGVIGPNGAGKTTTIRMCLGLTAPDQGSLTALGLSMPKDALAIKAQLGVVSQFDSLDPDFTCAENLLVYGRYFGLPEAQIRQRIPPDNSIGRDAALCESAANFSRAGMRSRICASRIRK